MNTHQFSSLLVLIFTCHFAAVSALVTPKTIEIMTVKMDISIGAITKYVDVDKDKDEEIEYKNTGSLIAGALSEIVLLLKSELNEPMIGQPSLAMGHRNASSRECKTLKSQFTLFISTTRLFLQVLRNKKTTLNTAETNSIREQLKVLQALWSSRKPNSQSLSFIEQQQKLYRSTKCYRENDNEIRTHNLDINYKLNSLIAFFC